MNIPEGWPTQEMCRGLIDFCNVHLDLSPNTWEAKQMILSALASAPTPPAQEVSYDASEKISDRLRSGKDGFFDKGQFPDSPAPEVEPYAYAYERTDLPEEMREFYGPAIHLKRIEVIPANWTEKRLYTHPANDGLRRAAEGCHKLDTPEQVFFYEQDFYVLSNFSAFSLIWRNRRFDTSEAAYHWEKFPNRADIQGSIHNADSAHEAFKVAERNKAFRREDWDEIKVDMMRGILSAKANQHEYVRRKLLATGNRELIEDSWRDDYWGWGPNKDGKNMLGKLWMEIRENLRAELNKDKSC